MSYALYLDPSQTFPIEDVLRENPVLSYIKLTDLSLEEFARFDPSSYPLANHTIAEIHPEQWEFLRFPVQRLSISLEKSNFQNLTAIKSKVALTECDITFHWDHRFHVSYYQKILQYWIHCGVHHVSFYELTDFKKWLTLKAFLEQHGFYFYDRYHACLAGHESRYQKHLARFGNLISLGGWSRVTENGHTRIRAPKQNEWSWMTAEDARIERLLFAFADVDGVSLADLAGMDVSKAVASGLAAIQGERLVPTDLGLWDTVGLVSQLQQN